MNDLFKTTLRINRATPDRLRAWAYLKNRDKSKYRSYSEAIIAAVNGFFGREQQLCNDPYLETREKEDAFLRRVLDTIKVGMQNSGAGSLSALVALLQNTQSATSPDAAPMTNEEFDTAMDFINSLYNTDWVESADLTGVL